MGKTYRSEGGAFKPRPWKQERDWKQDLREELEGMSDNGSKFIIANEWTPEGTDYDLTVVVGNKYFDSEDDAWEALNGIAESVSYELDHDETSFEVPFAHTLDHIERETFYIERLTHG